MLVSQKELRFDFGGAEFDLGSESDKKLLAWIFNQFLYGEVTGIQCGHWLYRAPHLNAASFLAKQAGEELSHVRKILRIFSILGEKPGPAHWAIRFLSTHMMGASWGEHVTMEMALGEGLVLGVFYAMADTIPQPEIKKILESASLEEERHVLFGERETQNWLKTNPKSRHLLLGMALLQLWALERVKKFVIRWMGSRNSHPVLGRFERFYEHILYCYRTRIDRLGLTSKPLEDYSKGEKWLLLMSLPFRFAVSRFKRKKGLLTSTYLSDPALKSEVEWYRSF